MMSHGHPFATCRAFLTLLGAILSLCVLAACQSQNSVNIPPVEKFTAPAVGTRVPGDVQVDSLRLPDNGSGALLLNRSAATIRVAVTNTITSLRPNQGFLFVLPPGAYQFYIYDLEPTPKLHAETIEPGKIRYLYLMPPPQ